jgi:cysteine desulfurase
VAAGLAERLALPLGNPNASHPAGRAARRMLEEARAALAEALGAAKSEELIFTSGGTESLALAVLGAAPPGPARIAVGATEHSAIREAAAALGGQGWQVDTIPVTATGVVTPESLEATLKPETRLVCLMMAQNEVGTVTDIAALSPVVRRFAPRARLIVDAVQAFTKIPFRISDLDADCLAVTAHKLHGPLGVGALWTRVPFRPLFKGGAQERGMRGGTEPAVLAWGFAEAVRRDLADTGAAARMTALRDALVRAIQAELPDATLTGEPSGPTRLPNNAHLCIPGLPGEPLLNALAEAGICASAGAACSTGRHKVSPTLQALGRRAEEGAFLRLTVGRFTRLEEVTEAAGRITAAVRALRPAYARAAP